MVRKLISKQITIEFCLLFMFYHQNVLLVIFRSIVISTISTITVSTTDNKNNNVALVPEYSQRLKFHNTKCCSKYDYFIYNILSLKKEEKKCKFYCDECDECEDCECLIKDSPDEHIKDSVDKSDWTQYRLKIVFNRTFIFLFLSILFQLLHQNFFL